MCRLLVSRCYWWWCDAAADAVGVCHHLRFQICLLRHLRQLRRDVDETCSTVAVLVDRLH